VGTWGRGLYDDDTSADVRDEWLKKVRAGAAPEAATSELIEQWGGADDEPLFWLALADTQWTWGRLEKRVRTRALAVLREGGDLELWTDPKARAARERLFERLAARLKQAPPPPKTIRVHGDTVKWARGQLWAYRTLEGRYLVFRVAAFDPSVGLVGAPVTELLEPVFDEMPKAADLEGAALRPAIAEYIASPRYDFFAPEHRAIPMFGPKVKRRGELPRHRLKKLAGKAKGEPRPASASTKLLGVPWDSMDQYLPNMYGVGGPRLGAVHAWSLPGGGVALTVINMMIWPDTLPYSHWQLGLLDCRDPRVGAARLDAAKILRTFIVLGFPTREWPREIGYRPPPVIEQASGAVYKWDDLPEALERALG
jgi:hypothetical protein